jgi:hypothetical protein
MDNLCDKNLDPGDLKGGQEYFMYAIQASGTSLKQKVSLSRNTRNIIQTINRVPYVQNSHLAC